MKTAYTMRDLANKPVLYKMSAMFYTRMLVKFDESYYCLLCINDRTVYTAKEDEIESFFVSVNLWDKCNATIVFNASLPDPDGLFNQPCNLIHKDLITQLQPEILRRQEEYNKTAKVWEENHGGTYSI